MHVDETKPGHFHWVLLEAALGSGEWTPLVAAPEPFSNWINALQGGMWALERYAVDERIGPRGIHLN